MSRQTNKTNTTYSCFPIKVHSSLRKAQQDVARCQAENETLTLCMNEECKRSKVLRTQLQDQVRPLAENSNVVQQMHLMSIIDN